MATKNIISPIEAAEKMKQIATDFWDDKEACRAEMKDIILDILRQLGYGDAADIF